MSDVRKDPHFFFGRHAVFTWLEDRLAEDAPHRPIVLQGSAGMGKTAVLQQIKAGRMGSTYTAAYVDLAETNPDSMSQLLWELANVFAPQVGNKEPLNRPDFVTDPEKAFETAVLRQLNSDDSPHLILLFDNFHSVQRRFSKGSLSRNGFNAWQHRLQEIPALHTIFTISSGDDDHAALFDRAYRYHIEPMTPPAASDLVRALTSYTFYSDVATYIGDASGGNPRTIIQVMEVLKATKQDDAHWQPTVADVAALRVLAPETAVSHHATYQFSKPKIAVAAPSGMNKRGLRLAGGMVGAFATVLLLLALFLPYQRDKVATQAAMMAGLVSPTAISTPLPVTNSDAMLRVTRITATPKPPTSTPMPTQTAVPSSTSTTLPPTITPTPSPTTIPQRIIRDSDGMEMLLIPAGTFTMGGRENDYAASPDERPLHDVQLDGFYMDKYEINLEQYAAFINLQEGKGGLCDTPANCVLARQDSPFSFLDKQDVGDGTIQYVPLLGYSKYPINNVSWDGAAAYCEHVNGRLPTEAEWEYAARGEDGRLYPWGDAFPNETRAIFNSESFESLVPVDGLPDGASAFGIYGMAGSMWEWTADWYNERYYLESPLLNPQGPDRGFNRVTRGGAWPFNNHADRIRSSNRNALAPEQLHSIVGFRCVQDIE